jgi:hypothetical protein
LPGRDSLAGAAVLMLGALAWPMAEAPLPVQQDPARQVPPSGPGPGELRRPAWRRRGWRWGWRWALLAGAVTGAAVVIAAVMASRYQPVGYGDAGSSLETFPGLPAGQGKRRVFSRDHAGEPAEGAGARSRAAADRGHHHPYPPRPRHR